MINRENGLLEIYERIKANRSGIGVLSFKRTPTAPIQEEDMPCIFMLEGTDNIIKHSSRGNTGYPVKRALEVTLEIVTNKEADIKTIYRKLRQYVFTSRVSGKFDSRVANNSFIHESRTDGPTGYGLPDILGMSLILDLVYVDNDL